MQTIYQMYQFVMTSKRNLPNSSYCFSPCSKHCVNMFTIKFPQLTTVHFHIRSIGKVRKLLSFDACASLIHALNGSRLDYCNSILYNLPDSKISRLQRIQNQAARILTRSPRREHITPVLKQLHWLKVRERIKYKILILTHKAFYGNAPPYLCSLVVK